jgi:nucleoside-diphosphate-sugar epimerase
MLIAVTGASGFVGGYIARALVANGHRVTGYGRRPLEAIRASVPNYHAWDIARGPIDAPYVDAVVHCAAMVGDWGAGRAYHAVNVRGTHAVLETFASADRFVHVSTTSVYSDDVPVVNVSEDASVGDCAYSAYGRSKAEAERVLLTAARPAIVLRPHIVYGPGDTTLLPRLLAAERFGRLPVPGTGDNRLSVTHVENLAIAVERALHAPVVRGVFNVSDAETPTVDELLTTVLARIGSRARIRYVSRRSAWRAATLCEWLWRTGGRRMTRPPPLTRYVVAQLADEHTVDITRAREMLGYAPRWSYRDGPLA